MIVVKKNSHLADLVRKITAGQVDEKTLLFGVRYLKHNDLPRLDPRPTDKEIQKLVKDFNDAYGNLQK